MKFISSTGNLLKQLQIINGVIGTRTVIPILEYFLFEIEGGKLTITGTDLEVSMRTVLSVESKEKGKIAVPSKLILEILKTLPEQPVTFTINMDNKMVELTSDSGKYKIAGESADDFPKFPTVDGASKANFPSEILASAINNCAFSIGNDELRPAMTGLYFQMAAKELRFVATDGNRLVLYKRTDAKAAKGEDSFILPKKALNLLKNALPGDDTPVAMEYNKLNAHFNFGDLNLVCRLIDERFPDYNTAIPVDSPNSLKVHRNDLLSALRRTVIFSNKTTNQVRFKISGSELNISSQDLDFSNEAQERLGCEFSGEDMEIGFNARFMIDMLNILTSDEIEISLSTYNRPGVLRPVEQGEGEDVLMLLMPIVLNI